MDVGMAKKWLFVALSAVLTSEIVCSHDHPSFSVGQEPLPLNFKPISYELNLTTFLHGKHEFSGTVTIKMTCLTSSDTIVLHSEDLHVCDAVVLYDEENNVIPLAGVSFVPRLSLMLVKSYGPLSADESYWLNITFTGKLGDEPVGYHRTSYVADKTTDEKRWLAITHFAPTFARRSFPCFDEPALKATFKLHMTHHRKFTAFTNTKLLKTKVIPEHPDFVTDEFEETPAMSTHLLAYMVAEMNYAETDDQNNAFRFGVVSRADAVVPSGFPSTAGVLILKFYQDYFDENYPLDKIDMVAVPDLAVESSNHWGVIFYRERTLLIDQKKSPINDVHRAFEVLSHELAHQWFGDSVTMKSWNDFWISEAFVSYVAARGVRFLSPDWNSIQMKTARDFLTIARSDSLRSARPVAAPFAMSQTSDPTSHAKGSFLFYTLNSFLGDESFKNGVRHYIDKYQFDNADRDDLWNCLTEVSHSDGSLNANLTVKDVMDTWTLQSGYPMIKVVRDFSLSTVTVSQSQFHSTSKPVGVVDNCWRIPLTMTTSTKNDFGKTKAESWLNCDEENKTISLGEDDKWVIYNLQLTGLYRVLYDKSNMLGIISALEDPEEFDKIHPLNRVQLIDDAFAFSKVGLMDYETAFELIKYLKHEHEYLPWTAAIKNLNELNVLVKRNPISGQYRSFVQRTLLPVYSRFQDMTVELKGFEEINFKTLITTQACNYGVKECEDQARSLFKLWMESTEVDDVIAGYPGLPGELESLIYCEGIKNGGRSEREFLWERYQRSNDASKNAKYLSALGCSRETRFLNRYLNQTIRDDDVISEQDAFTVFNSVANNEIGFSIAKGFLYRNIARLHKRSHSQGGHVSSYVNVIISQMNSAAELKEVQTFIVGLPANLRIDDSFTHKAVETVKTNIEYASKINETFLKYIVLGLN